MLVSKCLFRLPPIIRQLIHSRSRSTEFHQRTIKSIGPKRNGRHIVITGASRGIGLAIAKEFLKAGDRLCIVGRDSKTLSDLVEGWNSDYITSTVTGATNRNANASSTGTKTEQEIGKTDESKNIKQLRHNFYTGDISRQDVWDQIVAHLYRQDENDRGWSAPDVLINCAGITQISRLERTDKQWVQRIVDTNLMGTIWGCKYVGQMMIDYRRRIKRGSNKDGTRQEVREKRWDKAEVPNACIVNVSSLLAVRGGVGASAYAASKAGVLGLTRALAAEMGPLGIRVNAVVPGYIQTSMTEQFSDVQRGELQTQIPLGRFGTPEEVASAVMFLVNNEYANNCVLNLDGGLSAVRITLAFSQRYVANYRTEMSHWHGVPGSLVDRDLSTLDL